MHACSACLAHLLQICPASKAIRGADMVVADIRQRGISERSGRITLYAKEMKGAVAFLCRGWAVRAVQIANRRQILSVLIPGDIVSPALAIGDAELWFLKGLTDIEYRLFDLEDLLELTRKRSKARQLILRAVARGIAQSDSLAIRLAQFSAERKIASLMVEVVIRLGSRGPAEAAAVARTAIPFPLRQRHIAEATGMTTVHVSNVLRDLSRRHIAELAHRTLSISDWSTLQRLANIQPEFDRGLVTSNGSSFESQRRWGGEPIRLSDRHRSIDRALNGFI